MRSALSSSAASHRCRGPVCSWRSSASAHSPMDGLRTTRRCLRPLPRVPSFLLIGPMPLLAPLSVNVNVVQFFRVILSELAGPAKSLVPACLTFECEQNSALGNPWKLILVATFQELHFMPPNMRRYAGQARYP